MIRIRYIVALLAFSIGHLSLQAQSVGTGDTSRIGELLALQPSETLGELDDVMQRMEQLSAADIASLFSQLTPPGGDNAAIEYVTNSYSYHVMLDGKEQQRATFIAGAIDALATIDNKDNKGYLMQLLQQAGDDRAVAPLSSYLGDPYLTGKAARALARIGTADAGQALIAALPGMGEAMAIPIIDALGFMAYQPAERAVLEKAKGGSANLRKAVLYALSRIGGVASGPVLLDAASEADYVYEPTEATAAYINYLYRLIDLGETKTASRLASRLFKRTGTGEQGHTHIAALGLLTNINGERQVKTLLKAAKDEDTAYRNAALQMLVPYLDGKISARLVRGIERAEAPIQVDILRYAGKHDVEEAVPAAREALQQGTPMVRRAAITAIHQLDNMDELAVLVPLLESDQEMRSAIKDVLLIAKHPQFNQRIAEALEVTTDDDVRTLLVDVLAKRGAGETMPLIRDLIKTTVNDEVKAAAYAALPQIARPEDLGDLMELLATVDHRYRTLVQEAVVVSVNRSEGSNAIQSVIRRFERAEADRKAYFFPVFAGIGGARVLAIVSEYADGDDPGLRRAATSALANWNGGEALLKLVALSRKRVMDTDQSEEVMDGLVRVIGLADVSADQKVLHLRDAFEVARTDNQRRSILRLLQDSGTYQALLFAGQFLDDDELGSTASNTVINIALDNKQFYGPDVSRILDKVVSQMPGGGSNYLREAVVKHINELPQEGGYVSLFNGRDLEGWKGLVENPIKRAAMAPDTLVAEQAKADEMMREDWYAEGGLLHFDGDGYNNIVTTKKYGDIELLVDWKLDKEGEEGDAGIYLRGTPQVQIWDTSRINVGAQVGSGGLYNNQKHESKPLKVADNPLGEWNTFRITMIGDRVTVYLNGELVTDSVVLENYWDRSLPIFPMEQLELQAHGSHVMYRDIYVRELPREAVSTED